eukprot:CAMPEP_0114647132 /NCGR_PEP_ID=MMETSP0191-20121206/5591_1 /TAXON_ID=126664 /ORGANISM="Sorites sp." /LENGTH=210 /DNA_ID=CAMNT_0001860147 /DNA_START=118 /DNA_END=746 /DNA_ORIENTATION=+
MDSRGVIKYSTRIDAADFSDGQRSCCKLPLRWGTVAWGIFFVAAGICQILGMVYAHSPTREGYWSTLSLWILIVCMILSGASGLLGAIFQIRIPVTFFALMLLLQCCLEIAWFFCEDGNNLKEVGMMIWNEVLLGKRSSNNGTAVDLFYTMLSLNVHLWACGIVASYALELRIAGKAVWFEPIEDEDEDEDEEDGTSERRGSRKREEKTP